MAFPYAMACFSMERFEMERLGSSALDRIYMLLLPIMMDSTRDLESAVVSSEERGLGVFGLIWLLERDDFGWKNSWASTCDGFGRFFGL